MRKIVLFLLILTASFSLVSCGMSDSNVDSNTSQNKPEVDNNNDYIKPDTGDDLGNGNTGNLTNPDKDNNTNTDDNQDKTQEIKKELEKYSRYIFIDILDCDSIYLESNINEYKIDWEYDTSYFSLRNKCLELKKNGQTTIESTITKDNQECSTYFDIFIKDNKIEKIYQQDMMFYYMFIINNPQKIGQSFAPKNIVFHNTANTASAYNEVAYLNSTSNTSSTSFHYAVDDTGVYQAIPLDLYAHHAGDLSMNKTSIGVEIAKSLSTDNILKNKCIDNGAKLITLLQYKYHINTNNVYTHKDITGKHCPHDIYDRYGIDNFYLNLKYEE